MIKVVTLVENTAENNQCKTRHALSLFIETEKHKLLCDVGENDCFIDNAKVLGVDLSAVDTLVITHGHFDHGGALESFMKINDKAKIYIRRSAFDEYYTRVFAFHIYVGIDRKLPIDSRFVFTDDVTVIDDELTVFSAANGRKFESKMNDTILMKVNGRYIKDTFVHEQYLYITDGKKRLLLTGCSHAGIYNIIERFESVIDTTDGAVVIGGFHLHDPVGHRYEKEERINALSDALLEKGYKYYTCHCTGPKAYRIMKKRMGDRIDYCGGGKIITL